MSKGTELIEDFFFLRYSLLFMCRDLEWKRTIWVWTGQQENLFMQPSKQENGGGCLDCAIVGIALF